ncbi:periplasmic amidohydrolase [Polaribacter pacificus]|uniref:Periplasmic amidohydrolase n=1 Tax=Polaribacter pacificus TaxID=1775173 RepID=A0A917I008_9FLAO|nr:amidohydrolase family protein [Polaribacter pacificus]GGG98987.1 periplasmic amidohydrolase [Polaribacter pacificus]
MKKTLLLLLILCTSLLQAQEYFPTNSGVKTTENTAMAFTNATIYVSPTEIVKKGTLLIKDGKVVSVGRNVKIPKGTPTMDLDGKSIYPSFVELYSNFGMKAPQANRTATRSGAQYEAGRTGYYWNDHIRPETNSLESFAFDSRKASEMIKAGFGVVNTHLQDGIVRGSGILVALNPNSTDAYRILDTRSAQYLSLRKSSTSRQIYPNSIMGSTALLRQVYFDAEWYATGKAKNKDLSLEAFNRNKNLVQIFDAGGNNLNSLRVDKIGDENGVQYTIVGSGLEYENINSIKNSNATYIVPINFRNAYDVSNPYMANQLDLSDMRKWTQEPSNLAVLAKNKVPFTITTHQLKSLSGFQKNIQKAITYGLDETKALEALTTVPAKILGKSDEIGTLKAGSYANFLITSGAIFDSSTVLYENWVQGAKNVIKDMNIKDVSGDYTLTYANQKLNLSIKGKSATVTQGKTKLKNRFSYGDDWMQLTLNNQEDPTKFTRFVGTLAGDGTTFKGVVVDEKGTEMQWTAFKATGKKESAKSSKKGKTVSPYVAKVTYPNVAYGFETKPKQETLLIKNTTVWTSEKDGVLKNTDVLIKNGKISQIGKNLSARGAKVIDGTNKHLTAGIIDEHTHIALSSSNESGHNSTAEVTMEDAINPADMNIYRNLAGGVTSAQLLHGSANPIGGRSAIIKLKWGEEADKMIYTNAPKFIKFALGENVKQSRSQNGVRFPQTRMGVEQVFTDYFQRAKEYDALKKSGKPYRKDLELETLAEIINKERFVTAHSYVQSEINMLMKVADRFNFNINTLTHILEGYKVADKMKAHGAGGSTFADWWAYKYEVNDAIPYNAAIMASQGITVAINSDDREMSRRLNQEAAKITKYGGVSEVDAWNMVTINPAKLLHLDDRVGSIKVGKDADVVLWSDHPLSIYAKAEKTIIEGTVYFDMEQDLLKRAAIKKERSLLMNMMLNEKINGGKVQPPVKRIQRELHCDTEELLN